MSVSVTILFQPLVKTLGHKTVNYDWSNEVKMITFYLITGFGCKEDLMPENESFMTKNCDNL